MYTARSNAPHHDASGPFANTTSARSAALRSLAPSPMSTVVRPRYCASLIGACLQTPHDEHGQHRSSCGNRSSPVVKSTAFVSTSMPSGAHASST